MLHHPGAVETRWWKNDRDTAEKQISTLARPNGKVWGGAEVTPLGEEPRY